MFATGETVSLAEWIIDDTCLVLLVLELSLKKTDGVGINMPIVRLIRTDIE